MNSSFKLVKFVLLSAVISLPSASLAAEGGPSNNKRDADAAKASVQERPDAAAWILDKCLKADFDGEIKRIEAKIKHASDYEIKTSLYRAENTFDNPSGGSNVCIGYYLGVKTNAQNDARRQCESAENTRCAEVETYFDSSYMSEIGCRAISYFQGYRRTDKAVASCVIATLSGEKNAESYCKDGTQYLQAKEWADLISNGLVSADGEDYVQNRFGLAKGATGTHEEALLLAVKKQKAFCETQKAKALQIPVVEMQSPASQSPVVSDRESKPSIEIPAQAANPIGSASSAVAR